MSLRRMPDDVPGDFAGAVARMREARLRPEVVLEEVPAPTRVAPYSVALSADVVRGGHEDGEELAAGRFVLLHDPSGPEAWNGTYRAVTFVRAELEAEFAADPMIGDVGWSWLNDALEAEGADAVELGGTVTRVVSEGYGVLGERPPNVEIEVRASWTPLGELAPHLQAWSTLLCTVAGLPPLPEGVTALRRPS